MTHEQHELMVLIGELLQRGNEQRQHIRESLLVVLVGLFAVCVILLGIYNGS